MYAALLVLASVLSALPSTNAQLSVSNSTVPSQCTAICGPIIKLMDLCAPSTSSTSTSMSSMQASQVSTGSNTMGTNMVMMSVEMANRKRQQKSTDKNIVMMAMSDAEMTQMACMCDNKSFDVKDVMGLCTSCVDMNAGSGNKTLIEDMDMLMENCKFPSTSYAPSATTILAGINVQATATGGSTTGTAKASSTSKASGAAGRVEVIAGVWGMGMAMGGLGLGVGLFFGML